MLQGQHAQVGCVGTNQVRSVEGVAAFKTPHERRTLGPVGPGLGVFTTTALELALIVECAFLVPAEGASFIFHHA